MSNPCTLCPRHCGVDRSLSPVAAIVGDSVKLARAALHFWEEPCVSGEQGSGRSFFPAARWAASSARTTPSAQDILARRSASSGWHRFSGAAAGRQQHQPGHCRTLCSTGHRRFGPGAPSLHIPVVYNSSGYETVQTLRMLAGYVDVYLPDLKFYSPERSARYCSAPDYFAVASAAVQEMFAQTGPVQLDSRGIHPRNHRSPHGHARWRGGQHGHFKLDCRAPAAGRHSGQCDEPVHSLSKVPIIPKSTAACCHRNTNGCSTGWSAWASTALSRSSPLLKRNIP